MKQIQLIIVALLLFTAMGCSSQPDRSEGIVATNAVEEIYNFSQPAPNHAAGGQPKKHEMGLLADAGVDMVINLRSHAEMNDIHEPEWATENHLAYYHIPIAGADDLTEANVKLFHQTLWLNEDKNIFMHCASSNRVGAMMALRAAWFQGADTEAALAIGEQYGMTSLRKRVEELLNE
ncbi:beta-lactamase hydrolase domain-containing protein [Pseudidiomarina halophila]|uniref:Serine/threonine protein phosphatase n=1 Tax=Pseudidiomarina halophila TaxID=1449799 RepID=A0A432XTJ3_9GAMM|nr:sulfur transferase domain-containing protein [Pseudidiomarina halophila]RUO52029.1 serine/threonine protein phosphatase [Pseudidiomarina halophila]